MKREWERDRTGIHCVKSQRHNDPVRGWEAKRESEELGTETEDLGVDEEDPTPTIGPTQVRVSWVGQMSKLD